MALVTARLKVLENLQSLLKKAMEFKELKRAWTLPCACVGVLFLVQSHPVNTDTEGAIESVRIKQVEFIENVRAFFPQGQSKLSIIMCLY